MFYLKVFLKIVLFGTLTHSLCAESKMPYSKLSGMLSIASGKKTVGKIILVPIYVKIENDKVDITKLEFNLSNEATKKTKKLNFELLKKLPIDSLNLYDLPYLEDEYVVKLWVPLDVKGYKDWQITHNQAKGSISISIAKFLGNLDVEEKRDEYRKKLEEQKNKADKNQ